MALTPLASQTARAQSTPIADAEGSHSSSEVMPEFRVSMAQPRVSAAATTKPPCIGSEVLPPTATGATQYTQMQANFSLFFGLAVQAYMATLVSDNTPFDQFNGALNPVRQADGSPCPAAGCPPIPPNPSAFDTLPGNPLLGLTVFM